MRVKLCLASIVLLIVSAMAAAGQEFSKPQLGFIRAEDFTEKGRMLRMYTVEIVNRSEFDDELFAASPELPPCGLNANSSRTWINIYADDGHRIYGWCGIRSNAELSSLKFILPVDQPQPAKLYVDFVDRRNGKIVRSKKVPVEAPE